MDRTLFNVFYQVVEASPYGTAMKNTVEDSPWHREPSVWHHVNMCLEHYFSTFADQRSQRENDLTAISLLAHDFGKSEAEETLEKKDQPGVFYRRYAGHEPISGNEFMSFMCDQQALRESFFAQGFGWEDIRKIKFMIEHHLPYGLKNPTKRQDLRSAVANTLGEDEVCFWDALRSDAAGRISDDHEQKLQDVENWIEPFKAIVPKLVDTKSRLRRQLVITGNFSPEQRLRVAQEVCAKLMPFAVSMNMNGSTTIDFIDEGMEIAESRQKTLFMLVGVSGAGKSTWIKSLKGRNDDFIVVNEDDWRLEYAGLFMDETDFWAAKSMTVQERYDACWKFCHLNSDSTYDKFARARYEQCLDQGKHIVLDRMNQTRKGRGKWINVAKAKGFKIQSVEFYISEKMANARQITRGDKMVVPHRVHQIMMQLETPWLGPEVDAFEIVPQT